MFATYKKANKSKPHTHNLWPEHFEQKSCGKATGMWTLLAAANHVVTRRLWPMSVNLTDKGQVQITLIDKKKMH